MKNLSPRASISARRRSLSDCFGSAPLPIGNANPQGESLAGPGAPGAGRAVAGLKWDFPAVPASMFGIVLGLGGLANTWRVAASMWGLPAAIAELIFAIAALVWLTVTALYGLKWIRRPALAVAELNHPVRCCFVGLAAVAPMLIAQGLLPYSRTAALVLFVVSASATVAFAVWRTGELWTGDRAAVTVTPVLYLPTVAGGFVMAGTAAALGLHILGLAAYGAATLSWLGLESVLLSRLFTTEPLDPELRPTLGFLIAPPTVGSVALLALQPELRIVIYMLLGYAALQAMILLRMLPWISLRGFTPGYWAFTFGVTAFAIALLKSAGVTGASAAQAGAIAAFLAANIVVGIVAIGSLVLLARYVATLAFGSGPLQAASPDH